MRQEEACEDFDDNAHFRPLKAFNGLAESEDNSLYQASNGGGHRVVTLTKYPGEETTEFETEFEEEDQQDFSGRLQQQVPTRDINGDHMRADRAAVFGGQ